MSDIVSPAEIGRRLGVSRQLVHVWRERHDDFPKPIGELGGGKKRKGMLIWSWTDVAGWAKQTNRPIKPTNEWEQTNEDE